MCTKCEILAPAVHQDISIKSKSTESFHTAAMLFFFLQKYYLAKAANVFSTLSQTLK